MEGNVNVDNTYNLCCTVSAGDRLHGELEWSKNTVEPSGPL